MGNYTWFVRCVSNHPVDDDGCIPIIDLLAKFYHDYDWYFEEWVNTLSEQAKERLMKASKMRLPEDFKTKLVKDNVFPTTVSLNTFMNFFEDKKFYGYMDEKQKAFLNYINDHCLPMNIDMMMIGIYEGFGPVAMGWSIPPNKSSRRFVSMMGFETYDIYSADILRRSPTSFEEYIDYINKTYYHVTDPDELVFKEKVYKDAEEFRTKVLNPMSQIDWATSPVSICGWLLENGFEMQRRSTDLKTMKMMGCPTQ